jgi:hypothetical protein
MSSAVAPAVESALPPGRDPRDHARLLHRVREAALAGARPPAPPRPVIDASWRRVRRTGLDPAVAYGAPLLAPEELERRRADSGLGAVLPLVRERLLPVAEAAGQLLVVVDVDGRVLWRAGGADVRRRADTLGFLEGSAWDEASVGTNAIGTSLVVGTPVQVYAGEHYAEGHQPWTCAAAPVHDPGTGALLGALDLSGPAYTVHPSTVALVDAVARLAEYELRYRHEQRLARLAVRAEPLLARLAGPAVVVTSDGCTAAAIGLPAPARVTLPPGLCPGPVWVDALGPVLAEPVGDGWLLRLRSAEEPEARLVLDLAGARARVAVTGAGGSWQGVLGRRHAEILLALAAAPAGRTAAELADDLFGDPTRTVTVRAEVSRLRRTLGPLLLHQPYRLGVPAQVRLPADLGRLLPGSGAPVVVRARGAG